MPRHLAERVLRSRAALEGERKQVTVLFADVKGSLALIEHADPEDARRILDAALGVMMDARAPLRGHGQPGPGRRHHGAVRRADRARGPCRARLLRGAGDPARDAGPGRRAARRPRRRGQRAGRSALGRGPGPHDRQRPQHGLRRDRSDGPSREPDGAAGEPGDGPADRGDRPARRGLRRAAGARAGAGEGPLAADRGVRSRGRRRRAHAATGLGRPRPHALRRPRRTSSPRSSGRTRWPPPGRARSSP